MNTKTVCCILSAAALACGCATSAPSGARSIHGFHKHVGGLDDTDFRCRVDKGRFFFSFDVKDEHVSPATEIKHPLDIANGDRVEVYFVPDKDMKTGYRCAEIDCDGRVLSYSVSPVKPDGSKDYDWFWKFKTLKTDAKRTPRGYRVDGSVEVAELETFGVDAADFHLGVFRADLSKPGKLAAWCSAVEPKGPPNFHQPAMLFRFTAGKNAD